jgi:hypothetical protein
MICHFHYKYTTHVRDLALQFGGGLEYFHRSTASSKRRRKGNPMRGGITGPPCSWGIWIQEPGPRGWISLKWDTRVWLRVLSDTDHWVISLQIADPSSRHRGRHTERIPQLSDSNIPTGSNIWSQVPQGCSTSRHTDWLTDWPTDSRKVTSTSSQLTSNVGTLLFIIPQPPVHTTLYPAETC